MMLSLSTYLIILAQILIWKKKKEIVLINKKI